MPETWLEAVVSASLKEILYDTENVDCKLWNAQIDFHPQPNGRLTSQTINGIPLTFNGPPWAQNVPPLYKDVGGYCGAGAPEAVLRILVTAWGTAIDGCQLMGTTDAYFSHPSPSGQNFDVEVFVLHSDEGRTRKARLRFRITVRSMC